MLIYQKDILGVSVRRDILNRCAETDKTTTIEATIILMIVARVLKNDRHAFSVHVCRDFVGVRSETNHTP